MRTSRNIPQLVGACWCALTIIAAAVVLLVDPVAAAEAAAPVVSAPSSQKSATNVPITMKGSSAISVADPDSPILKISLSFVEGVGPAVPSINLATTAGLTFLTGDGVNDKNLQFQGTTANLNAALHGMTIIPTGTGGTFNLTITARDAPSGSTNLSNTKAMPVIVTDDLPTVSAPAQVELDLGTTRPLDITLSDPDSPIVRVALTTANAPNPARPTITLGSTAGLTFELGGGTASQLTVFHGSVTNAAAALHSLSLTSGTARGTAGLTINVQDALQGDPNIAEVTSTINQVDLPSAPTNLSVQVQDERVLLGWSPPASAGALPLTSFRVTPFKAGTAQPSITVGSGQTALFVQNLANTVPYRFQVQAVNADGAGDPATTATVTPQGFIPFASAAAAVDRMFLDLLGRAPTASERAAAVAPFTAGTGHLSTLTASLRTGAESTSTVDPVTRLYRAYLLRIPDAGGLNFWIRRKRNGARLDTISQSFATSNEFKTRYGSLSNQAFVELIYHNLFDRNGDAAGIAFWTKQLDTGKRTRGRVMTGFSESNEYKTKQVEEVEVSVLFIFLLSRAPSTAEFNSAVTSLTTGSATPTSLAEQLTHRTEYITRVT